MTEKSCKTCYDRQDGFQDNSGFLMTPMLVNCFTEVLKPDKDHFHVIES